MGCLQNIVNGRGLKVNTAKQSSEKGEGGCLFLLLSIHTLREHVYGKTKKKKHLTPALGPEWEEGNVFFLGALSIFSIRLYSLVVLSAIPQGRTTLTDFLLHFFFQSDDEPECHYEERQDKHVIYVMSCSQKIIQVPKCCSDDFYLNLQ